MKKCIAIAVLSLLATLASAGQKKIEATITDRDSTPIATRGGNVRVGQSLTMKLEDGRVVSAFCLYKYKARGDYDNSRNCKVPRVDHIQVEFTKDEIKLFWESLDGKHKESETYKIDTID